jgi:hypothetical protein
MARPAKVKVEKPETVVEVSDEDSMSDVSDADEIRNEWEGMEDEIADLVDHLKRKLGQIDPGIGDRLTLARFVRFIEANSSALY